MPTSSQCYGTAWYDGWYGGFYFVHVLELYSEVLFARRYDLGCNFWDGEGRTKQQLHPTLYRLGFLCLPWSQTNYLETAIWLLHAIVAYRIARHGISAPNTSQHGMVWYDVTYDLIYSTLYSLLSTFYSLLYSLLTTFYSLLYSLHSTLYSLFFTLYSLL